MEVKIKRRGRPKRRWMDDIRAQLREKGIGISGEEVYDRAAWKRMSLYIDTTQKLDEDE